MKQQLSTAIDFYLETDKINPFFLHLSGNASSSQLIQLRNSAFVLNKLSLLNLEHSSYANQSSFQQTHLELYVTALDSIINNPSMPYKDFQSVRDLVGCIQHYHLLLAKLTLTQEETDFKTKQIRRKVSLNSFWPRIRVLMIGIEQKIPSSHQHIKEYVTIRRGLLQTDKKYFVSQMMAKKIETKQLKQLIQKYENQQGGTIDHKQEDLQKQKQNNSQNIYNSDQLYNNLPANSNFLWTNVKKSVRMIPLTNQLPDWKILLTFLTSEQYLTNMVEQQKKIAKQYILDIISDLQSQKQQTNEDILRYRDNNRKQYSILSQNQKQNLKKSQELEKIKLKQTILQIIQNKSGI